MSNNDYKIIKKNKNKYVRVFDLCVYSNRNKVLNIEFYLHMNDYKDTIL